MTQADKASRLNIRATKAIRSSQEQAEEARDAGRDVILRLEKAEEQLQNMNTCLWKAGYATRVSSYRSIPCTFAICTVFFYRTPKVADVANPQRFKDPAEFPVCLAVLCKARLENRLPSTLHFVADVAALGELRIQESFRNKICR